MSIGADSADEDHVEFYYITSTIFITFGLVPGLIILKKGEKDAFYYGGIFIMLSKILIVLFFKKQPSENGYFLILLTSILGGQGALLVTLSSMQTLLKHYTVVCSGIISMLTLGYYNGSDTFFVILKNALGSGETSNSQYQLGVLLVSAVFFLILWIQTLRQPPPYQYTGFARKLNTLTKGLYFKSESKFNIACFAVFVLAHLVKLKAGGWVTIVLSVVLILSVVANLMVILLRTDQSTNNNEIAKKIKPPSKIERFEADCDKLEYPKFMEVIKMPEIWCFGIVRSCMEASCSVFYTCSEELALSDDKLRSSMQKNF